MTKEDEMLPNCTTDASSNEQQQQVTRRETQRPHGEDLVWQIQMCGHNMLPGRMHVLRGLYGVLTMQKL